MAQNSYIAINTKIFRACWTCVRSCQQNVLGYVNLPFHKHVKIVNANDCIGCYRCIKVCPYRAIAKVEA